MVGRLCFACMGALAVFSAFSSDISRQYSQEDVRVWKVGAATFSTECTDSKGTVAVRRKIAMLAAGRAIVRSREGTHISGHERLVDEEFTSVVDEDVLGMVRPLTLVGEFEAKDGKEVLLCITVKEERV